MNNREKAKQVIEQTLGIDLEKRFVDVLKGCEYLKNTECAMFQDCEHCQKYHFWYKEYTGEGTQLDIDNSEIIKKFKSTLCDTIVEESKRKTENGEYIYSINDEKVFVKLIELIWKTNV